MDDLMDLLAEVVEAGDLDGIQLDEALSLPDPGLDVVVDGQDLDGALDPLLEGDAWASLDNVSQELAGEIHLGAKMVHGDPLSAVTAFKQQCFNDSCAVACQSQILQQFSGQGFDEQILAEQARTMGWYVPGSGTPLQHTGSLLELHGLDTANVSGASVADLKEWLGQGKAIIAGVDGEEIWNADKPQCTLSEMLGYPDAGHAVQVTGVEEDLSSGVTHVILNDPGQANGAGIKVPLRDFMDAWEDTGNFACVVSRS